MEQYSSKTIINEAVERLAKSTKRREGDLWSLIRKFILSLDARDGELLRSAKNTRKLAEFEEKFLTWLKDTGYERDIKKHLKTMDAINKNVVGFHRDVNDITVSKAITEQARRTTAFRVARDLLGSGVTSAVTRDLQDILFGAVNGGGSLTDVLKQVRERATNVNDDGGLLQRHTTQISRDLLNQYSGSLHDEIRKKHNFDAYIYINSIVKNSRAQCKRWRKKRILLISELPAEIRWAYRNGSGMIKGTTVFNFAERRGGYSCRHEALPTRSKK